MDKKASISVNAFTSMELVIALFSLHFFGPAAENDWSGYLLAITCLIAAQIIVPLTITRIIAVPFGKSLMFVDVLGN